MHFLQVIVFTLTAAVVSSSASHVVRQSSTNVPSCFNTCATQASVGSYVCNPTNPTCVCNESALVSVIKACLEKTCLGDDPQAAFNAGCLALGVTLSASTTSTASFSAATTVTVTVTVVPSGSSSPVHRKPTGAIIGGVIGGLVLVLLVLLVVFLICRRTSKSRRSQTPKEMSLPETAAAR